MIIVVGGIIQKAEGFIVGEIITINATHFKAHNRALLQEEKPKLNQINADVNPKQSENDGCDYDVTYQLVHRIIINLTLLHLKNRK